METIKNHSIYFLLICIIGSAFLVFSIISPFFGPLILAAVFAFLFNPIFEKLTKFFRGKRSIASFFTTILALLIILGPVSFLITQVIKESTFVYNYISQNGSTLIDNAKNILPIPENFDIDFKQYLENVLAVAIQNVGSIFSSFTKIFLNMVIFILAFYFLLKDGSKLKDYFVEVSPLEDRDDQKIVSRLKMAVSATVKGSLMIGMIQGTLTGIGLAIFGVPNAVFWGTIAAVSALIPGIGTSLVLIPSIAFLFLTGNNFGGFGLLVWGALAVGLIDNFLSPKIVGKGMHLHPLLVFISVIGGLAFFGPLGFILGPLTSSVFLALIEIYFSLKTQK
jgi:predicted PurR-regulated permease PerM